MIRFVAHSDGKVIVPDEPVELPEGKQLQVSIEVAEAEADALPDDTRPLWLQKALDLSKKMPKGLPRDLAEQHDHYIHGTPKR